VAEKVHIRFWRDFRQWVKEINPQAYITGEIWWDDWKKNKMYNAAPWLQGDVFDGVMNYRWGRAARMLVIDSEYNISAQGFVDSLQKVQQDYGDHTYSVMNMVDSHDMERLASQVVNPDYWPDHGGNLKDNPEFNVRKPTEIERLKHKLIVAMQLTSPGIPAIYYGDEAGMWGADDPDCRKAMVWPELSYEPERSHPFGTERLKDEVVFDHDLFDWYKKLIVIRKNKKALSLGETDFFLVDNSRNLLGYKRSYQDQSVFIIINNNAMEASLQLYLPQYPAAGNALLDLISDSKYVAENNNFPVTLQPYQLLILE
jgi:glycosidase